MKSIKIKVADLFRRFAVWADKHGFENLADRLADIATLIDQEHP